MRNSFSVGAPAERWRPTNRADVCADGALCGVESSAMRAVAAVGLVAVAVDRIIAAKAATKLSIGSRKQASQGRKARRSRKCGKARVL